MKKRAVPIRLPKPDNTFEMIMAHYLDPLKYSLSEKQEEIRKRWAEVLTLRLNYYSRIQIANKFNEDYGISLAQAYVDIRNSELLYGNVLKADKEGTRAILYEYAHKFYQLAIKAKDLKAMAKGLELMAEFGGVKDMDNQDFNPEKLENKEIKVIMPKSMIDALKAMVSKGSVDFNDFNVTDINYEEVSNGE